MRYRNENASTGAGTPGAGALIAVFAVLCLTIFAMLTLSTVLADGRIHDSGTDRCTGKYEALNKTEEYIASLREKNEDGSYTINVPVSDTRTLVTVVEIENGNFSTVSQSIIYTAQWNESDSIAVYKGN